MSTFASSLPDRPGAWYHPWYFKMDLQDGPLGDRASLSGVKLRHLPRLKVVHPGPCSRFTHRPIFAARSYLYLCKSFG